MRWENEMAQNEQNRNAAGILQKAVKRTNARNNHAFDVMADRSIKNTSASTLQAAIKRTLPAPKILKEHYKKQDRATQNFQKLTQELGDTVQYGNTKGLLNEHEAYKQNISNFGKLSKGSTQNRKEAWKEEIKNIQQIRQDISAPQQAGQTELFGGLRSGKTRMQKHRDENPELNQLRQQLSIIKEVNCNYQV